MEKECLKQIKLIIMPISGSILCRNREVCKAKEYNFPSFTSILIILFANGSKGEKTVDGKKVSEILTSCFSLKGWVVTLHALIF